MLNISRLLRIVSTDSLALHLFCFNVRQHHCQILYFKLQVDSCKLHYRRCRMRPYCHRLCTVDL